MKRSGIILVLLVLVNILLFANVRNSTATTDYLAAVEQPAKEKYVPDDSLTCVSGGPNTQSCSIAPGIPVDGSVTVGCSVSCTDGYYACCGLRCICLEVKPVKK